MPCVYEFWPSADMSVPETQLNQGFANRALPVMYLSTANSGDTFSIHCLQFGSGSEAELEASASHPSR
jgi:hypothetical protein